MDSVVATIKAWVVPLLRTFLAAFVTVVVAGLVDVRELNLNLLEQLAAAGAVAGLNAVVLVVQRALPGVPNPQPPAA